MHLTNGMLDAILTSLSELLAGEGPQGFDSSPADQKEADKIMDNAHKAHAWVHEMYRKRAARKAKRAAKK